jgi:hypothetical protein
LSRLVQQDGLQLAQGATEGDCLRTARQAALPPDRYQVAATVTTLWLNGAYGDRWPDSTALLAACAAWQAQFAGQFGGQFGARVGGQSGAQGAAAAPPPSATPGASA